MVRPRKPVGAGKPARALRLLSERKCAACVGDNKLFANATLCTKTRGKANRLLGPKSCGRKKARRKRRNSVRLFQRVGYVS